MHSARTPTGLPTSGGHKHDCAADEPSRTSFSGPNIRNTAGIDVIHGADVCGLVVEYDLRSSQPGKPRVQATQFG